MNIRKKRKSNLENNHQENEYIKKIRKSIKDGNTSNKNVNTTKDFNSNHSLGFFATSIDESLNSKINGQSILEEDDKELQLKLKAALEFVRRTMVLGASNIIENIEKSNGRVRFHRLRYQYSGRYLKGSIFNTFKVNDPESQEEINVEVNSLNGEKIYSIKPSKGIENNRWYLYNENEMDGVYLRPRNPEVSPLTDKQFHLTDNLVELLKWCLFILEKRQGNCIDQSCLLAKYLWENSYNIHRIEVIATNSFNHVFVIVNRSGNLHVPSTWGKAWIIDPWYNETGIIYPASRFNEEIEKIKAFAARQAIELESIDILVDPVFEDKPEMIQECLYEIHPQYHHYPTYFSSSKGLCNNNLSFLRPFCGYL